MGLHSSLKRAEKLTSTRSVMKRTERIKWLREKGAWKEASRVLGLPKIKVVKIKTVKKEKAKEEKPALEAAVTAATPTAEPQVKPAPSVKSTPSAKPSQPKSNQ
jgi:small basic protein (TIGR04137 family)